MGAGNLEGVAHLIDIRRKNGNLPAVVVVNEVARQAAGDASAVRPLATPASDKIAGFGIFGDGKKLFVWHNGPPDAGGPLFRGTISQTVSARPHSGLRQWGEGAGVLHPRAGSWRNDCYGRDTA